MKSWIHIIHASDNSLKECEQIIEPATLLFKETRTNHNGDYPLHNRYFSNGDKPLVILINKKNPMELLYDGKTYLINENQLVLFDDNIMHAWKMKNNDMTIYYYRAVTKHPVTQGTYCLDDMF